MHVFIFLFGLAGILFRKRISRGTASFNSQVFGIDHDPSYYEPGFVIISIMFIVVGLLAMLGFIEMG